jgi:hypothetical protein
MQLIYCRDVSDYVACAGPIGRFLLARGKVSVILDANEPVEGLFGRYTEARGRRYFRGPQRLVRNAGGSNCFAPVVLASRVVTRYCRRRPSERCP